MVQNIEVGKRMTKMVGSFEMRITPGIIAGANNAGLEAFGATGVAVIKKNLRAMKIYDTGYEISSFTWRTSKTMGEVGDVKTEDIISPPPFGAVKMGSRCKYVWANENGLGKRAPRPAVKYSYATMKPVCIKAFWLAWSRVVYGAGK